MESAKDSSLESAIQAELQNQEEASSVQADAAYDGAVAELKNSIDAQVREASNDFRQPGILDLAFGTVNRIDGVVARLANRPGGRERPIAEDIQPRQHVPRMGSEAMPRPTRRIRRTPQITEDPFDGARELRRYTFKGPRAP